MIRLSHPEKVSRTPTVHIRILLTEVNSQMAQAERPRVVVAAWVRGGRTGVKYSTDFLEGLTAPVPSTLPPALSACSRLAESNTYSISVFDVPFIAVQRSVYVPRRLRSCECEHARHFPDHSRAVFPPPKKAGEAQLPQATDSRGAKGSASPACAYPHACSTFS